METRTGLETIRKAVEDLEDNVASILKKDDKMEIATIPAGAYVTDLSNLLERAARIANPVLERMGLEKEQLVPGIEEFVKILEDNRHQMYFASVNLDAKYNKNKNTLTLLQRWFKRLEEAIGRTLEYMDTDFEKKELERVFKLIDSTEIPAPRKKEIKEEVLRVVNRLNR